MKRRDVLAVFNRGRISRLAVARTDVSRVALSAAVQTNWLPRTLGAMSLRPGLGYKGTIAGDGAYVPFIYATDDVAILELSPSVMRVWDDGDSLVTRAQVATTIFEMSTWTDDDDAGATSSYGSSKLTLTGTGYAAARRYTQVSVSAGDASTVHALRIVVGQGPVILRIGTSAGEDDIRRQTVLRTGTHSIAFRPNGDFYVEFSSALSYPVWVNSCSIEQGGTLELPTPWSDADTCRLVRTQQSGDVIFAACQGVSPRRIERRSFNSWSVVAYEPDDGPFLTENTENLLLTPSGINGNITIQASRSVFRAGHVGALFRLTSQGQLVQSSLSADLTYTNPIRVTGVEEGRVFKVRRSGTWAGTLRLQRSVGQVGSWVDVAEYTGNGTTDYDDELDNSIAYYRLGFNSGDYTSGTADASLEFSAGSITGVVRITARTTRKLVDAVVLKDLGGTAATEIWAEGAWSDAQIWPEAVAILDGRLWWAGDGRIYGSVSDAFETFDPDYRGDAAPINRSIGEGAVNRVNWMLPMQRLIVGTDGAEHSIRSNSLEEPITPSNFNSRAPSTKGSYAVPAVKAGGRGYFVSRSRQAIFEIEYDATALDFAALETTLLVPEIGGAEFVRLGAQQHPDLRIHAIRGDGTAAILIRDKAEDVLAWVDVETDGVIEDVCVLPGAEEDRVFYRVKRTIGGVDVRYHEEWALASDCRGGAVNRQADSFVVGTNDVAGLDHLEGETVVIWGDGADQGTGVVSSGEVAGHSYANWCVGLSYAATYQSAKLAGETGLGLSLTQRTRIDRLGLILADTHAQGLEFGPDFTTMDSLPLMEAGAAVDEDSVWESYDADGIEFPGDWSTDNRICLRAQAPRPCTVLAAVLSVDRQDQA